jgi:HEPN domain-containing protein
MQYMFKGKRYTWALFLGHLSLEKLLKALYAKTNLNNPEAPRIHNLVVLAEKCGIILTDDQHAAFRMINTFNIEARYEDYKNSFYKECNKNFAQKQIEIIKEQREWLKKLINK